MNRRLLLRFVTSIAIFVPFYLHASGISSFDVLKRLEAAAYDALLVTTLPNSPDDRIVIVDIDEYTMSVEGQWPWPRDKLAKFVDILFEQYRVKVLSFDVIFPEPDGRSAIQVLDSLAENQLADNEEYQQSLELFRDSLDFDQMFADSLKGRNTVVGFSFSRDGSMSPINELPPPIITKEQHNSVLPIHKGKSFTASLPIFTNVAAASGFINNESLDRDGSFRRAPVVQEWNGDWYPSLALATTGLALGTLDLDLVFHSGQDSARDSLDLEWLTLGDKRIPVDEQAAVLIPYRAKKNSFPIVSATDVLSGEAPLYPLQGAIVLVGTSAIGLHDLRVTPVSENYRGVEVQASIISGILDDRIKHSPRYIQAIESIILLALTILGTLVMIRLSPLTSTLAIILLGVTTVALNRQLWLQANLVVPLASSCLLLFLIYLIHLIIGYFSETRGRRQLSARFGEYIPPELVEEMGRNPAKFNMESASKVMTVMFTDVRGFTGISEALKPRELSRLMNEFLTPMTQVIHSYRGTIDKYIGDAIMAFWGAPLDDPNHARNAVYAAVEMQHRLAQLNEEFSRRGWPLIRIGIGINSGTMRVGDMGSQFRKAYTVMGDAVNLAARLEGVTKVYGVDVAVSEETVKAVPEYQFIEVDLAKVKGRDEAVAIYSPLMLKEHVDAKTKQRLTMHKNAMRAYRQGNWDVAESAFFQLQQFFPNSGIYPHYLDRIAKFRSQRDTQHSDGVYLHAEK